MLVRPLRRACCPRRPTVPLAHAGHVIHALQAATLATLPTPTTRRPRRLPALLGSTTPPFVPHPAPATFDTPLTVPFRHRVLFTADCLAPDNPSLALLMGEAEGAPPGAAAPPVAATPRRAIALVDAGVAEAWPDLGARLAGALAARPGMPELRAVERVPAGEASKQDMTVAERVVELVHQHGIDRQSFVLAIGGGAVQDAVGFGAAIAHRGCRLVRIATTTLAQGDAAMAVKCGVNTHGKKNFTGAFAVPWGTVCDAAFLPTSPAWSWLGGFSEVVKIALLRDPALFAALERQAARIVARDLEAALPIIERSAELHYRHIVLGGDPFEQRSARPLDYGHWIAHRLEGLTNGELPHGQAVAVGVAVDTLYSACAGLLPMAEAQRVVRVLQALGLPTTHALLARRERVAEGLEEFREHLGGQLTLTLLAGIGAPVDVHDLRAEWLERAVELASAGS